MYRSTINLFPKFSRMILSAMIAVLSLLHPSCKQDDPKPVNEEEVVTTLMVTLVPDGIERPVNMKFFDEDGEHGMIAPVYTVSGSLKASTTYSATIELLNETLNPALDISQEIEDEAEEHLFCFDVDGEIIIEYGDTDANGLPLGRLASWITGSAGEAQVTIILRHQAGTKTGACPGEGETDVEVTFNLAVE